MKVTPVKEPFPYLLLEDIYGESECKYIWMELELLSRPGILLTPEFSGTAKDDEGCPLKANLSVWLDSLYQANRNLSPILSSNRKLFEKEVLNHKNLWFFEHLQIGKDFTLVSYYENNDRYDLHSDSAQVSALTWFYKSPKQFTGGVLKFPDFGVEIPCNNNSGIIFPSQVRHMVTPVTLPENARNSLAGRFCISQFMHAA